MDRKWLRWLLAIFLVWQAIRIVFDAVSVPWTWTLDQCVLLFWALCLPMGLVVWGRIWKRGGMEAIKDRWREIGRAIDTPSRNKASFRRWFWFFVVVLLVIAAFQAFVSPHV